MRTSRRRVDAHPDDANLKYLALRCQPDSVAQATQVRQALARWPDNGWLAYMVAVDQLDSAQWGEALPALERARTLLPSQAERMVDEIARLKRFQDPQADLSALVRSSPHLAMLVGFEGGGGEPDSPQRAYAALAGGQLDQALLLAKGDPEREAYLLRLVGASSGASAEQVRRAMALRPDQGMNAAVVWLRLAMAMREGENAAPHRALALGMGGRYGLRMAAFLDSVNKGADLAVSERLLDGVHPQLRAIAYSAAMVLTRGKVSPSWRTVVQRVLFAAERPYFA